MLELGLSYLYDANSGWKKTETAVAADGELHRDAWSGRFEYMVRKKVASSGEEGTTRRGWHITPEYALGEAISWSTTLFARYERGAAHPNGMVTSGAAGDERDVRIAAGFSSNCFNSNLLQWKFEVQRFLSASPSTGEITSFGRPVLWFTQLVFIL